MLVRSVWIQLLIFLIVLAISQAQSTAAVIEQRLARLSTFLPRIVDRLNSSNLEPKHYRATFRSHACNYSRIGMITEFAWGNTGNHMVSLTHMLWLSKALNFTFLVPSYISDSLHPLRAHVLDEYFCLTHNMPVKSKVSAVVEVESVEAFSLSKLFFKAGFKELLPPLNDELIQEVSDLYLAVYTALWSKPADVIQEAARWLIRSRLDDRLDFASVHKRSFEGGCAKVYSKTSRQSDFLSLLPMDPEFWRGSNPLCEMSARFVNETMVLHGDRGLGPDRRLFVAFDGRGNIDDYRAMNATFSSELDKNSFPQLRSTDDKKHLDMFVLMLGRLAVLNPYSTFSFQVFVIRAALGLTSVPIMLDRDIFFHSSNDSSSGPHWVSFASIQRSLARANDIK